MTETAPVTTAAETTAASTTITSAATTITSAETTTAATETTSAAADLTAEATIATEADLPPIRDAEETAPPFGDLHGAHVCVGGTAIYPGVYVLTKEDTDRLADAFNSLLWTEMPKDKYVGPTPGPSDIEFYFYKDGVFSELDQFGSVYIDENGQRHYFRSVPAEGGNISETAHYFSLIDYVKDPSRIVSTHLAERFKEPIRTYTDQECWALVWDDVLPFIAENDA